MIELPQLKRILEAALLAAGQPLAIAQLAAVFGEQEPVSHDDLAKAIAELQDDCRDRGVELVEVASGFRYQVRQDVYPWVARLWTERQTRYSRALLETLALIAYRQPITRAEIEQIRGVAVSTHIVKTLEEREWVRVVGHRDVPGKPALFGTTRAFLDYFNLRSLDQLPPLSDIRDIEDLDPQFAFGGSGEVAVAALEVEESSTDEAALDVEALRAAIAADDLPDVHAESEDAEARVIDAANRALGENDDETIVDNIDLDSIAADGVDPADIAELSITESAANDDARTRSFVDPLSPDFTARPSDTVADDSVARDDSRDTTEPHR